MDTDKIYQMFILGRGNSEYPLKKGLGGVIFFSDDICSVEQFKCLILNLKSQAKIPLFLSIDQEGGRVERTEKLHDRYLSPMYAFRRGIEFLKNQTAKIAEELVTYGINMNFSPCLDVNTNAQNPVIKDRAFSDNPHEVCMGYDIVSNIYRIYGIIPVIKHFPGHGGSSKDSHKELPIIDLSLDVMEKIHILPFKYAIEHGAEMVMAAHLHCTCFDAGSVPASLSKNCLKYLRDTLNFNGVIISDDMLMQGAAVFGLTESCLRGINAGINMFIYRNSDDNVLQVIENVIKAAESDTELRDKIEYSYDKIIKLKQLYGIIQE